MGNSRSTRSRGESRNVKAPISKSALDQLFYAARTFHEWLPVDVPEATIRELYDLLKWAPTSANSNPARFVWVRSDEGKARLAETAFAKNRKKILTAPITVIIGNDLDFANRLPDLVTCDAVKPMQRYFSDPVVNDDTAVRNATLQGGYLILAARALGLDCGPMSGFDNAAVDKVFFKGTGVYSNFICSLGYGDASSVFQRMARLPFDVASHFA